MINTVSYSRLATYEKCPHHARLAYVDKLPENPFPEGQESPLDRGTRIHEMAEHFIEGKIPMPKELSKLGEDFEALAAAYIAGSVLLEELWCYDDAWQVVANNDWDNIWLRIKGDAIVFEGDQIVLIDFKTGKHYGNEVKHYDQVTLYALAAHLKYPEAVMFRCELWYLDHGEKTSYMFSVDDIARKLTRYQARLNKMCNDEELRPRPNIHNCRFCAYKTGPIGKNGQQGTGACTLNPL